MPSPTMNSAEGKALKVIDVMTPKVEPPPYCVLETLKLNIQ
jgi:hypothetical protein